MSSPEQDPHLQRWLPQLEIYRAAMEKSPDEVAFLDWCSPPVGEPNALRQANENSPRRSLASDVIEPNFALRIHPDTLGEVAQLSMSNAVPITNEASQSVGSQPVASQIVHLPIDGILKRMAKVKSFVLGVGTVGDFETPVVRHLVTDIVERCCSKTQRNGLLVTIRPSDFPCPNGPVESVSFREAHWTYMGVGKLETKLWHSQLAELPLWKKDFGLIVFDLGDVCLPMMPRVGRLCDGIVVQMLNPANSRDSIKALRSLQKERLPILGAWSVDFAEKELAA